MPSDIAGVNSNIFKAMPANMKPFIPAFARATPSEQQKILPYLPEAVKPHFQQIWDVNTGGQAPPEGVDSLARGDEIVADYFSQRALPGEGSNVWNPQTSTDEYRLQTYENEGLDYHSMGIPEAQAVEYRSLGRAEVVIDSSPFSEDMATRNQILRELGRDPNVQGSRVYSGNIQQNSTVDYNDPRRRDLYNSSGSGRF